MAMQARIGGESQVMMLIRISLEKCAMGLGIALSDQQKAVLCADIFEVYQFDSIEDVHQCLKKARQGQYGFEHFKRDSLSMPLIKYWMSCYLDEKAKIREKIILNRKNEPAEPVSEDAQKYIDELKRITKAVLDRERQKPTTKTDDEFWMTEFNKNRYRRLVFALIRKKHSQQIELSERETAFIDGWGLKKHLQK